MMRIELDFDGEEMVISFPKNRGTVPVRINKNVAKTHKLIIDPSNCSVLVEQKS
jgi:hypothetical protein